jgi:hypothetical protein
MSSLVSRRSFLTGLSLLGVSAVAACAQLPKQSLDLAGSQDAVPADKPAPVEVAAPAPAKPDYISMYQAVEEEGYRLPAIPFAKVNEKFLRQVVDDPTGEKPGTIVVNTVDKFLYLVLKNGKAMRYGVGLGRQGYSCPVEAQVADLDTAIDHDFTRSEAGKIAPGHAAGCQQSAGFASPLYLSGRCRHAVPHSRFAGLELHRQVSIVGLRAHVQSGRDGSL